MQQLHGRLSNVKKSITGIRSDQLNGL